MEREKDGLATRGDQLAVGTSLTLLLIANPGEKPARLRALSAGSCGGSDRDAAGPATGAPASAGRCLTSQAPTGPRSTPRCPTRSRSDPFHVVRLANDALDEVRRRVQNQTLGHRGHKHDPLYRARKLLIAASERITDNGHTKLRGLLDSGDPYGEVRDAWHGKETLRAIYDAKVGAATVDLAADFQEPGMPEEINRS